MAIIIIFKCKTGRRSVKMMSFLKYFFVILDHICYTLRYNDYHDLGYSFEYSLPEILSIVDAVRGR